MHSVFSDVLDTIDTLPFEQQEKIVDIVNRRLAKNRRQELLREIEISQREIAEGKAKFMTVDEIMKEISS